MGGTLVLNASYEVLASVSWQRAVTLVVTGMAEIFEADHNREIRSKNLNLPFPKIIRLLQYVIVKHRANRTARLSKKGVLQRDNFTCAYCAGEADTVDHVFPQSRGGGNTWENMAACCKSCNQRKADRTPEEAGMRLRWHPYKPDVTGYTQHQWRDLEPA